MPCGGLPLNLAVWTGDVEILQSLIDRGAEMVAQDSNGNTVPHCVNKVNKSLALKVFDCLLAPIPEWTLKSTTCKFLKPLNPASRRKHGKQLLFLTPNSAGYTPLTLAAKLSLPVFAYSNGGGIIRPHIQ